MWTPMSLSHFLLLLPLLFLVEITSTFNPSAISNDSSVFSKPRGIVLNLIHPNSVVSPYYNPNATQWDLTREAIAASLARARSYNQIIAAWKNGGPVHANGDIPVVSDRSGSKLIAKIFVGKPEFLQYLLIDTGSSITFVHCKPCENCPDQEPGMFDPQKSSTYSYMPCIGDDGSMICEAAGGECDDSQTRCLFSIQYADETYIKGVFANETLVFGGSSVAVNTFGCANKYVSKGKVATVEESGLLGLGIEPSSILHQFGRKFSHCFGDLHNTNYQYHKLFLGEAAKLDGPSIPIVLLYGHYYVGLEWISFGGIKLNIDPNVFKLDNEGRGGTVLDSGTSLTFLKRDAYDQLATKVTAFLDPSHQRHPGKINSYLGLCYKGKVDEVTDSPPVTLHFNGGAQIVLDGRSLFVQEGNVFCLTFSVAEELMIDVNIIGAWAQQFYNVGFDANAMKVHIQRADCKDL